MAEEERVRAGVHAVWATEEGREALGVWFGPRQGDSPGAEDLAAATLVIVVGMVKAGAIGRDDFTSPEAWRVFCERNGVES